MSDKKTISLAWTGASGARYGVRLLEALLADGHRIYLMVSRPAQIVLAQETDLKLPGRAADMQKVLAERYATQPGQISVFGRDEWTAPVASGSARIDAMVVCPCTMATLSAVAVGASRGLIERAADVMLKENRPLILVPRETPLSAIHLENMLRLARAGAVILPANPGFYHDPDSIDGVVDFVVARILDQLGVRQEMVQPWGEDE